MTYSGKEGNEARGEVDTPLRYHNGGCKIHGDEGEMLQTMDSETDIADVWTLVQLVCDGTSAKTGLGAMEYTVRHSLSQNQTPCSVEAMASMQT